MNEEPYFSCPLSYFANHLEGKKNIKASEDTYFSFDKF